MFRMLGQRRSDRLLIYLMFKSSRESPIEFAHRLIGIVGWADYANSGESWFVETVLPKWLTKPHPVLFDVGANVGHYSQSLRKAFPDATIHAFEPNPECWAQLDQMAASDRINVHHLGLGTTASRGMIWRHNGNTEHSTLYPEVIEELHRKSKSGLEIELGTLDDFLDRNGLEEVDFLKVDTEGHEIHVLRGAAKAIRSLRIGIIQFEFNTMNIISRTFLHDFFLELPHYAMFRITRNGLLSLPRHRHCDEIFDFQNIVAIRDDMKHLVTPQFRVSALGAGGTLFPRACEPSWARRNSSLC
jgi:FkbM family methyltransferase